MEKNGNIRNYYFEKKNQQQQQQQYLHKYGLESYSMLGTSFPSFISKKTVKFWYLDVCWRKIQFWSIFHWKKKQIGQKQQLWRHCDVIHGTFVFFWYLWKEKTHSYIMVPNKHTSIKYIFFQVHKGLQQPSLVSRVKKIAWSRVKCEIDLKCHLLLCF